MAPNNFLACTNMNVVFLGEAKTQLIKREDAQSAIDFGLKAEDPAIRRAAKALQLAANANDPTGANSAVIAFVTACHKLGIGPGDNG